MFRMKNRFSIAILLVALVVPLLPDRAAASSTAPGWTGEVLEGVIQSRIANGRSRLETRRRLSAVAQAYAEEVAALPHKRRLTQTRPIEADLERGGVSGFRRASLHLDMGRGYRNLPFSFAASWRRSESAWLRTQDPKWDAVGVGSATGSDHWVVFVAIFIEDILVPSNLVALEEATIAAVNAERAKLGLRDLTLDERLRRAARLHSQSMAKNDFFSHTGLDGSNVGERAAAVAIDWAVISENIHTNQGYEDPVAVAVSGWMESAGHRKNIVNEFVRQTAVGVAISEDGKLYFTQLFLLRKDF